MAWPDTVINLASVIAGFLLAAVWEAYKEKRRGDEEARNIRQLLAEEIQYNKVVLKEVVTSIRSEERRYYAAAQDSTYGSINTDANPWRDLGAFVPSRLSNDAWNSQMQKIPSVLVGNDAARMFMYYRALAEIQALQTDYIVRQRWQGHSADEPMQKILSLMEGIVNRPLSIR